MRRIALACRGAITHALFLRLQITTRQRLGQGGEDVIKDPPTQILRDFFFIRPRFVAGIGVKAACFAVPGLRQKRGAAKEQEKEAQAVTSLQSVQVCLHTRHAEQGGKFDLKKLFSA